MKSLDLFAGAGGMTLGFKNAGIQSIGAVEIDRFAAETFKHNFPEIPIYHRDIYSFTNEEISELFSGVDIVAGGPPCQGFSVAGPTQYGIIDKRNTLIMEFFRFIEVLRPKYCVLENVKGILSGKMNSKQKALSVYMDALKDIGYISRVYILQAADFGVPQFRERFVLIGSRDHEDIFLPLPTHFQMHQDPAYRWKTVGEAIADLENEVSECGSLTPERKKYLRMVPEGGNWKDLPKEVVSVAMGGAYESGGGKVGFYRRLSYAQPSPTITTAPAQKATMLCHPIKDRPLSIHEYARIQQFPEDWIFVGTTAAKYKQIGNAVPCRFAKAVASAVRNAYMEA